MASTAAQKKNEVLPDQAALIPEQSVLVITTLLEHDNFQNASGIYRHFKYLLAKRKENVSSGAKICLA